jgi:hypothetical protein
VADNVGYTPGSGATVAADDVSGALHQRIKLTLGADGVSDGDVSASNPMPVDVSAPVAIAGSVDVVAATPLPVDLSNVTPSAPLPVELVVNGAAFEVHDAEAVELLSRLLLYLDSPRGYDKSLQRERVTAILESGTVTTVTTVTTCATVTNLSTIDTLQGGLLVRGQNMAAWAQTVRARIT